MDIELTGGWEPAGRHKRMVLSLNKPAVCPCGEEPIGDCRDHAIGLQCQKLVVAHVRRRFGAHRYGGRLAHHVDDAVQDCFMKLLVHGGLDSFRPPPDRPLAVAFRAWLFAVVRYHCNNRLKQLGHDPIHNRQEPNHSDSHSDSNTAALGGEFAQKNTLTPEGVFAREWLRSIAGGAVADVEARWRARRKKGAERFSVLLPIALDSGSSYRTASEELGILCNYARWLVDELRKDLGTAARKRVEDELRFEPGLSREGIETRVDAAIKETFDAAFPGGDGLPTDLFCWFYRKTKSEAADRPQPMNDQPHGEEPDARPESEP